MGEVVMKKKQLGFIGLGNMGQPIASNLVSAGMLVQVFDLVNIDSKAPKGATIANSIAEIANQCSSIFLSLPDGEATLNVARQIAQEKNSAVRTLIDLSTVGIKASKEAKEILEEKEIQYIDAPVSGGKSGAIAGTISLMWAGPKRCLEDHRGILRHIAKNVFHVGENAGQGQSMKLLNNFLSATAMAATSEAVCFGLNQGLTMETMLNVLNVSTGRNTASSDKFPNQILNEKYQAGFLMSLMTKDVSLYFKEVENLGAVDRIAQPMFKIWKQANQEFPGGDFTEIFRYFQNQRGKDASE